MPDIDLPFSSPAWVFLTLFLVALVMPLLAERARLPGVIGLVLGGLLVGPQVFGLLQLEGLVAQLGGFGVLYLMFLAGLELDLDVLQRGRRHAGVFGLLTFAVPLTAGTAASLALRFDVLPAVLIGSFWASHTLVAYPTIRRHGLTRDPAVTATLGATILTDGLALIVLAVVVALEDAASSPGVIALRLSLGLAVLGLAAFVGLPRLTLWFFRGLGQDGVLRFLFVMAGLLGLSAIADLAGTEPIVGAFFAGLALNRLVPESGFLMRRIEFVGTSILIPAFLISVGMLIDLSVVTESRTLALALAFAVVTIVSKYIAAWIAGRLFGFDRHQVEVMFSLSVAQAAATLAAAVVGFEAGVIGETTVNAALLVILVTVLVASWSAARAAPKVKLPALAGIGKLGGNVLVPIANLTAAPKLVELALLVARSDGGEVVPLHIVTSPTPDAIEQAHGLRIATEQIVAGHGAEVAGVIRVDASVVRGITHSVLERDASLVVIGWTETPHVRRLVLGSVVDDVVARIPAPVAVAYLPHLDIRRVVVMDLKGVLPTEANAAGQIARSVARSAGVKMVHIPAEGGSNDAGRGPVIGEADMTDHDLVVIAAPIGALARSVEDVVASAEGRPLVAIRSFAGLQEGGISEIFTE